MNFSKENKIIIGVLVLLIVLSVGYALFSETININGSATAKGDFGFTTTCDAGLSKEIEDVFGADAILQGGYKDEYCSAEGTTVNFGATLLYPTSARVFTITMKNTGSIPAKFNAENDITMSSYMTDEEETEKVDDVSLIGNAIFALSSGGQIYTESEGIPDSFFDTDGNIIINPNDALILIVGAEWNNFGTNEYNHYTMINKNTITVNFEQITAN